MVRTFDTPINSNDQSIERVLAAGLPVMLVFLNGPTLADLAAAMDSIARQNAGNLLVVKLQTNDSTDAARRFAITRAPSLVTVKNGQAQSKAEGITAGDLQNHAGYLLGKAPKPAERPQAQASSSAGTAPHTATGGTVANGQPMPVSDATFEQEVMRSSRPVLVDFWAPWCGPCRVTNPIVEKLAHEMSGRMKVAKVNVDENPMIAQRYGIQSIPTMMLVKDGTIVDRWVGALPEQAVRSRITPVVGS